jgi:ABC-2 type transport system permease protein
MHKIVAVARKELKQILRDRLTLVTLLFVPAFFLVMYGYALNFDIKHVYLGVQDRDGSALSRGLVSAFANSGYFDVVATPTSDAEIERLMNRGDTRALLIIPEDFSRRLRSGQPSTVQVLVNGDNANTATTVLGYTQAIIRGAGALYLDEMAGELASATVAADAPISVESRVWYNPELRSTLFLVPGLVGFIVMLSAVVSTALSVVREKERGTLEQVRMAPISTFSFVVGKTIPYLVISFISAMLIVFAAMALFDMPMRGSWLLLLFATSLFLAGALGFGLFISTVAESQQVAFQIALITSFLPTFILSGFIFPIASMPAPIRAVTYIVPARYYLVVLRGILLKGIGAAVLWKELMALAIFALVVLALAALRLPKQKA